MSAYMVDREHIKYLVHAALKWGVIREPARAAEWAQRLWDENKASILYRYPDCKEDESRMPGTVGETYDFGDWPQELPPYRDAVQVIKACHCYEYQACEHPGWETSLARQFTLDLVDAACAHLPGYDDAAWGAPREAVRS